MSVDFRDRKIDDARYLVRDQRTQGPEGLGAVVTGSSSYSCVIATLLWLKSHAASWKTTSPCQCLRGELQSCLPEEELGTDEHSRGFLVEAMRFG